MYGSTGGSPIRLLRLATHERRRKAQYQVPGTSFNSILNGLRIRIASLKFTNCIQYCIRYTYTEPFSNYSNAGRDKNAFT